ncbi:Uncharacterised protein [Streptococcus criceti]|uniref:hypothetical protein n=1 Tax=Streptococcus criceti TaxID=1333 RepID=UPI000225E35E|nr:hypothetical protein [Streptococcus criceti]SUN38826.1 Uncharacterised protein [Streptococcus criceti]
MAIEGDWIFQVRFQLITMLCLVPLLVLQRGWEKSIPAFYFCSNNSLPQCLGERLVGSADLVFPLHSSLGALAPMNHC